MKGGPWHPPTDEQYIVGAIDWGQHRPQSGDLSLSGPGTRGRDVAQYEASMESFIPGIIDSLLFCVKLNYGKMARA